MNKPVAWMRLTGDKITRISPDKVWDTDIPLYTHPVKEHDIGISHAIGFNDGFKAGMQRAVEMNVVKELTDEEIQELANIHLAYQIEDSRVSGVFDFAKAILRKAQEK